MVFYYILEKNNVKIASKITKHMFEEVKKEFIEFYENCIKEKELLAKEGEEALKKDFMAVINLMIKEDEKEMKLVKETFKEKGLTNWQKNDLKNNKYRLKNSLIRLDKIKNKEFEIEENEEIKIRDNLRFKVIQATIYSQNIKEIKEEIKKLKYEDLKNIC